jgi:hypothetical protein
MENRLMRRMILLLMATAATLLAGAGAAIAAPVNEVEPNDSFAQAQDLDGSFSLEYDPNIFSSTTIPHATVNGTGNYTYDYYSFRVPEAGTSARLGILDMDRAMYSFDSYLWLYDGSGRLLQFNDDSTTDPGSVHPFDSMIHHVFATPGTYYVQVGRYPGDTVPAGGSYQLHVSVADHAVGSTDTTPPVLNLPGNIEEEATGPDGAAVNFQASATDEDPASPQVSCSRGDPPVAVSSGDTFPVGTTTVSCRATDASGNVGRGSFDVTVGDTTAPAISGMPSDQTEEATGPDGAQVSWQAPTANDAVDGETSVDCSPASGATFALGATEVICTATDSHNNSATETFDVTVRDTTAPAITGVPANITVKATSPSGARVTYASPEASDLVDGTVGVSCSPASGSTFALGITRVDCSASDSRGNSDTKTFEVGVFYDWAGFFNPVNNPDVLNVAKAGSAIPVKFSLGADMGLDVFYQPPNEPSYPKSGAMACDSTAPVDAIEQTVTAGSSGLNYDATTGRYTYVWKTNSGWAGTCRQLVVKLDDGKVYRANFKLR